MSDKNNINDDFVEIIDEDATVEETDESLQKEEERKEGMEAIRRFADDEGEGDEKLSFRKIMGGDILLSKFFLNQVIFIVFCVALLLFYTGNRYSSLQDIIEIDNLSEQYQRKHSQTLTQSSKLLNKQRQSSVEKRLYAAGDTTMLNNNLPPFALPKQQEE
jgi:hypothetical protein